MFPRIPLPWVEFGLPTYGIMVALGFLAALALAGKLAPLAGFTRHEVQDIAVWACIVGLVGAKVALLIVEPGSLSDAWRTLFQGGIFYGGFVGSVLATVVLCRRRGLDVHSMTDVLVGPAALGHALGRVGCFLAGCCWGAPCEAPWAVHFTHPGSLPVQSFLSPAIGLHPVQLYEAAANLALAAGAAWMISRRRFSGQVGWSYVVLYGAFRFVIEHWRGDERGAVGPFSTSQAVALAAMAGGLIMLAWCARRARTASAAGPVAQPPKP